MEEEKVKMNTNRDHVVGYWYLVSALLLIAL